MPDRWSLQWPPGGDMGMRRREEGQWVSWDDAVAMVAAERERIRASIETLPRYEMDMDDAGFEAMLHRDDGVWLLRLPVLAAVDAAGETPDS